MSYVLTADMTEALRIITAELKTEILAELGGCCAGKDKSDVMVHKIITELCKMLGCRQDEILDRVFKHKLMDSLFCDKPEDRLYHASDGTWWMRRKDGHLVGAPKMTGTHWDSERQTCVPLFAPS